MGKNRKKYDDDVDLGAGYDENDSFIDNTDAVRCCYCLKDVWALQTKLDEIPLNVDFGLNQCPNVCTYLLKCLPAPLNYYFSTMRSCPRTSPQPTVDST